jgi:hypothetical protein
MNLPSLNFILRLAGSLD